MMDLEYGFIALRTERSTMVDGDSGERHCRIGSTVAQVDRFECVMFWVLYVS